MSMKSIYQKEKGLVWTGLAGIVLGLICIIFYLIQGDVIPPEGKWSKAISFDLAVGIFTLTTAICLPFVEMTPKQTKWFVYPIISSFWIAYAIETIQNARGFDPRFTKVGAVYDKLIGLFLGLVSIVMILSLVYFMIVIFKQKNSSFPHILLSLRYACLSIMLAFISGIWMTILLDRVTPDGVNIMVLHFVGFHGYQAIPIIGWLVSKANLSSTVSKKIVHASGISWIIFTLALFVQSVLGYSIYQFSIILVIAGLALGIWAVLAIYSFIQYLGRGKGLADKIQGE